jgi:hypothetical protein
MSNEEKERLVRERQTQQQVEEIRGLVIRDPNPRLGNTQSQSNGQSSGNNTSDKK